MSADAANRRWLANKATLGRNTLKSTYRKKKRHMCEGDLPAESYGAAIDACYEDDQGRLWVSNGEYSSAVNFCPYCGQRARVQATEAAALPDLMPVKMPSSVQLPTTAPRQSET